MIITFKCKYTQELWLFGRSRKIPSTILRSALRKLLMLDSAYELQDLSVPPNNKLEALKGDREYQYSIRINNQYRICFTWQNHNADNVEIIDYH